MDTTLSDVTGSSSDPSWLSALTGLGRQAAELTLNKVLAGDQAVKAAAPAAVGGAGPEKSSGAFVWAQNNWKLLLGIGLVAGVGFYFMRR